MGVPGMRSDDQQLSLQKRKQWPEKTAINTSSMVPKCDLLIFIHVAHNVRSRKFPSGVVTKQTIGTHNPVQTVLVFTALKSL